MVLWTPIRGDCSWLEARRTEGAPGLRGSRRGVFDPFHWARRDAKHARLPLSVTATAVTPSPPGKGASPLFLVELGRGSPTVAPLRVRLAPSALVERGGVLLRRPTEATPAPPAMPRLRRTATHLFRHAGDAGAPSPAPQATHAKNNIRTASLPCRKTVLSDCQKSQALSHSHSPSADCKSKIGEPHRGGKRGDAPARRFSCFSAGKASLREGTAGSVATSDRAHISTKWPPATLLTRCQDSFPAVQEGCPVCVCGGISPSAAAADPLASPAPNQTAGSAAPASGDGSPPSAPR